MARLDHRLARSVLTPEFIMYEQVTQTLRDAYDQKVDERDNKDIAPWKARECEHFLAMLKAEEKRTLLEIGAGTGKLGRFFLDHGLDVIATDLSPAMVESCRAKGLDAHVMDFLNLDFPNDTFDAVFAMNTLLHVPKANFQAVLESVQRVLKPSGLFYLGQYGGNDFEGVHKDDHYRPQRFFSHFTDDAIKTSVSHVFALQYFEIITFDRLVNGQKSYNFQSLILRNQSNENNNPK